MSNPILTVSLTQNGIQSLLTKGAYKTFNQISVGDGNVLYDVMANVSPDLELKDLGGTRSLTTSLLSCGKKTLNPISKTDLTPEEESLVANRMVYNLGLSEDCANTYEVTNLDVTINVQRYINYLLDLVASDYTNTAKIQIPIFDYINVTEQRWNPTLNSWENLQVVDNLLPVYGFKTDGDMKNYQNINMDYMSIVSGRKQYETNINQKFPSPMSFFFTTQTGVDGEKITGQKSLLTMNSYTFGYVAIRKTSKSNIPTLEDFYTITELEMMESLSDFKTVLPAAVMGRRVSDIYYLTDLTGMYSKTTDPSAAIYVYRFKNYEGKTLVKALTEKLVNFMKYYGTQSLVNSEQWELNVNMYIKNNTINGLEYNNIVGGNLTYKFVLDLTDTDTTWDNILTIQQ